MPNDLGRSELREAVGVITDQTELEPVVQDLLAAGFEQGDISLLAAERTVTRRLGGVYQDSHQAEDDPKAPRRVWAEPQARTEGRGALASMLGYLGAVSAGVVTIATGGGAAAVIAAGVIGGGAMAALGTALGRLFEHRLSDSLRHQIEHGGIVLWVRLVTVEQEIAAQDVLRRHGAQDVHVHDLAAG